MRTRILDQPVYIPGIPIEKVAEQYGINYQEIIKLASNENPWGASPNALDKAKRALEDVHLYPDGVALFSLISLLQGFLSYLNNSF